MVKLVQKIIQAKKESGISNVSKDVVDVLLNDTSDQLTDDLIADNMIDMMIPGEDSVPLLMTLAIKYLSDSPTALQQLTVREHSEVLVLTVDFRTFRPYLSTIDLPSAAVHYRYQIQEYHTDPFQMK